MMLDGRASGLLTNLYSAPLQPELWDAVLADLSRLCNVSKAALVSHDFKDQVHTISVSFGDPVKDSIKAYETHYYQFDEWTTRFPKSARLGSILRGAEICPQEVLFKSVFYNEFLKPYDVCEIAVLFAGRSENLFEALSLYRGPNEEPLEKEQLAILQTLAPHLQTALAVRRRLLALESRVSDLEAALDQLGTGLILLDADAKPVLANQAARQVCDQRDGLRLSVDRLTAQYPGENGRLRAIISRAISAGRGKTIEQGGAMLVSRRDKRPLHVLAAPFITQNFASPRGAVAVIFISDPEQKPAVRSEVLQQLYGLTQAEARLALLMLRGDRLRKRQA